MTNSFYTPSGTPSTGAPGASASMRSEYTSIGAGFDKMPALSGNGSKAVIVNAGGTALTVTTGTLALAGNFATTGAFSTTLAATASVTLTLPAVTGTLATLAGAETLSNKTLVGPALGTPASGVLTNCTGTAAGLTAGNVTTNANLTGPITSSGNATSIGAQTGTGNTFVMNTSPTLVTPVIGVATGTSLSVSGQLTSTVATGTAPLVVSSTTVVSNLNVSSLLGSTWAAPGTIGSGAPSTGAFTTISATGQITSTLATGTAPLVVASTTAVTNLNASLLLGSTWAAPGTIGSGTPSTGAFTTLSATGHVTVESITSTGATGSGAFVFATAPTVTTLIVSSGGAAITGNSTVTGTLHVTSTSALDGAVTGGSTIADSVGNVRSIVHSGSDKATAYSLQASDNGQYISIGASGSIVIPNSTFADGNAITLFNNTSAGITITCNTTTAYISGVNSNKGGGGTVTVGTRGLATILFLSATSCVISGNIS